MRKINKHLLAILIAVSMLLSALPATAQGISGERNPINPYYYRANHRPSVNAFRGFQMFLAGARVKLSSDNGDYFDGGRTWTATVTGSTDEYAFEFYLVDPNDRFAPSNVHCYQKGTSNTFNYVFMVTGTYELDVWASNLTNPSASELFTRTTFTIEDENQISIDDRVSQIVEECRTAGCTGDFETAVWLHDWLTHHARYDFSYTYYSADSVLLRGLGVCDSYSKAYVLLLEEAGIEAERVTGGDHAWNAVKLDGEWYQIDPTWDDPYDSQGPVSTWENHMYFGLTDALMMVDHEYTPTRACTHLEDNYFIHTGKVSMWTDDLAVDVYAALDESRIASIVPIPDFYAIEKEGYSLSGLEHIVYGLSAYAMRDINWQVDGLDLKLLFDYDTDTEEFSYELQIEKVLDLPSSLESIGQEAFADGGSFMAVVIPDGCCEITEFAFAGNGGLWKAVIPESVTAIADTAFDNCPHINIICPEDSYAWRYAQAHRINCIAAQ